jgi:predicted Rossmann fold flavoprotein
MPDSETDYDAIILGAGAAGMMCAAVAGQYSARTLLIDHSDEPGRKILISGGGRCNFTNLNASADNYLSTNPHFAKSALSRYTPSDFLALVDRHNIRWHEKTLGQLFCDGSARQIVAMLLDECAQAGVELAMGATVSEIEHSDARFQVRVGHRNVSSRSLVIATGGLSIPKLGATGFAYELARRFGHKVVEPRPGLVPLTLDGSEQLFRTLSGVSTDVVARCGRTAFREAALFTHRGLSGPAILQISSYWRHGDEILINFLSGCETGWLRQAKRDRPKSRFSTLLSAHLPERLADALAERIDIPPAPLADITDRQLAAAEQRLSAWPFRPNGSEGFAKAEVTAGGISTAALSSQTMESRTVPGLYAIGEAVDVTGWLGGYNFQWAWASGWAAGSAIGART